MPKVLLYKGENMEVSLIILRVTQHATYVCVSPHHGWRGHRNCEGTTRTQVPENDSQALTPCAEPQAEGGICA